MIEARRPRLTLAEKDVLKGGGTPAEWTPARRAQIDRDGRWTLKRGRKREGPTGAGHQRLVEIAVPLFGYKNHVGPSSGCSSISMPSLRRASSRSPLPCAASPLSSCRRRRTVPSPNSPVLIEPIIGRELVAITISNSSHSRDDPGKYIFEGKLDDKTTLLRRDDAEARGVSLGDFYAYMPTHTYIFTPACEMWPKDSVNARFPPIIVGGAPPIKASIWLDQNRPVEQMTWAPGLPMIIKNRLVSEGGWIERRGVSCFNLYRPPLIKPGETDQAGSVRMT